MKPPASEHKLVVLGSSMHGIRQERYTVTPANITQLVDLLLIVDGRRTQSLPAYRIITVEYSHSL